MSPRGRAPLDLLRVPVLGALLRWRHVRTALQFILLFVAAIVVLHGLFGPQVATTNLATTLIWIHYRGLLVIGLLAAGNFFCMGCPFVLVRDGGRRLHLPRLRWPRRLRSKWIGVALFAGILFAYELFDLWSLPRATAFLVIAYFVGALATDLLFSGATFCKYLCPVGQFNFVASTVSPLELQIKQPDTCRACRTVDCIKGRREPAAPAVVIQRGCELNLFLPLKVGNMDCTFCLDCVHACPYDNIALATRVPGAELADTRRRSGVGWLTRRWDIAALAMLFVFGGILNAFAMVSPVFQLEAWLARATGAASEAPVLAMVFIAGLALVPAVILAASAVATAWLVREPAPSARRIALNYAYAFVPFGFGMWLAHYSFHLLTGALTIVPIAQSAASDALGWTALGEPLWRWSGMRGGSVFPIQLGLIALGTIGSLALAYRISEREYPRRPGPPTVPWAVATMALCVAAIWILSQPMDMRGVGFGG